VNWYLIIFTLHMLAAENVSGGIQVIKFTSAGACEKARVDAPADGIVAVCTSNQNDVSGFVAAMNCHDPHTDPLPGEGSVVRVSCAPYISVPK
jgi:hypothetical protein